MTFRQQVGWARKYGALLFAFAGALWGLDFLLAAEGQVLLAKNLAVPLLAVLFIASVLFVFGGVMRPIQKSFYHYALEGSEVYRLSLGSNFLTQRWFWLDSQGRDLDRA
jgi:hypothetical protein